MSVLAPPYDRVARVLAGALVIVALVGTGVWIVGERHERRRLERQVCVAEWGALRARNPYLNRYVAPADPCVALRMVAR